MYSVYYFPACSPFIRISIKNKTNYNSRPSSSLSLLLVLSSVSRISLDELSNESCLEDESLELDSGVEVRVGSLGASGKRYSGLTAQAGGLARGCFVAGEQITLGKALNTFDFRLDCSFICRLSNFSMSLLRPK